VANAEPDRVREHAEIGQRIAALNAEWQKVQAEYAARGAQLNMHLDQAARAIRVRPARPRRAL